MRKPLFREGMAISVETFDQGKLWKKIDKDASLDDIESALATMYPEVATLTITITYRK